MSPRTAPGPTVPAPLRSFSALDQRRRRSTEVIISTCAFVTSQGGPWEAYAVDDRVRSLPSSDPGSAIEAFDKKSAHYQLTDLGMKLRQLNIAVLFASAALLVEHLGELFNRLALPRCNFGQVQFVLGRQLGDRLLALDRSSATLALNSAENRLSVLMVIRPPYRRIHLTGVSGAGITSNASSIWSLLV